MDVAQIVIDTNVFYSALRSQLGASHLLLREVGRNDAFQIHLSVPLVLEYEEIAKRHSRRLGLTYQDVDDVLDYLCSQARLHNVHYLWRPYLPDREDDMLLELAVEADCQWIVTYNLRDFDGIERFGIRAITPAQLLTTMGVIP